MGASSGPDVTAPADRTPSYRLGGVMRMIIAADALARHALTFLEELALAVVPAAERNAVTFAIYARANTYAPAGTTFTRGLLDWEAEAVRKPPFPQSGRILVGGAGGGREVAALAALGYEVVGFEPSALSQEGARASANWPRARMVQASYDDLVRAASGGAGPLADVAASRFDAVILGMGSLSHLLSIEERVALLRAIRAIAPAAPVLMSYLPGPYRNIGGFRRRVRSSLRRLGLPGNPTPADHFQAADGFHRRTDDAEVDRIAAESGYRVHYRQTAPYGHALLVPRA